MLDIGVEPARAHAQVAEDDVLDDLAAQLLVGRRNDVSRSTRLTMPTSACVHTGTALTCRVAFQLDQLLVQRHVLAGAGPTGP